MQYLALIRGINVGGKGLVKMDALKTALTEAGFQDVRTYIQSGNIFFSSTSTNTNELAERIETSLKETFGITAGVAIFSKDQWQRLIANAPAWWGRRDGWKHNLLILIGPHTMAEVVAEVGALKPDIEAMQPGEGVLYQSMSLKLFGRTTTGKLISSPLYKRVTVRNYNTAVKLRDLFE